MSSIIKKRRGGSTYLYAATSARVEGRPRIVEQVYLGTEDEVIARLTATPGGDPGLPDLEAGFRQAKDPHVVSFAPIRHFTDHKIRVHLFTCVLALTLAHLMRRECARAGLSLSVPVLLAELDGIGETVLLYQGERGRPRARHTITKITPTQQHLYTIFDLDRYAPSR